MVAENTHSKSATGLPFFFGGLPFFPPRGAGLRARNGLRGWRDAGGRFDAIGLHYYTITHNWQRKGSATAFDEAEYAETLAPAGGLVARPCRQ